MPREDSGAVDNRLHMHGIPGLRVIDAIVSPVITDGHPQVSRCVRPDMCYRGLMLMSIVWTSGRGLQVHGGKRKPQI